MHRDCMYRSCSRIPCRKLFYGLWIIGRATYRRMLSCVHHASFHNGLILFLKRLPDVSNQNLAVGIPFEKLVLQWQKIIKSETPAWYRQFLLQKVQKYRNLFAVTTYQTNVVYMLLFSANAIPPFVWNLWQQWQRQTDMQSAGLSCLHRCALKC